MITKPNIVAIAAVVVALATPSVAAAAKVRQPLPTWDTCFTLAVERGSAPGRGGSENNKGGGMGHYVQFMNECLAGKIPLSVGPSASARATR
jgi:ABC-type sugar transport system substrate-binding protein